MSRFTLRASRFIAIVMMMGFALPAAAVDAPVHCWCKQETTEICNHVERTFDNDVLDLRDAFGAELRNSTCTVCREYCAGLAGGPWTNFHCEPSYREAICSECYADASSSCTVARGARERTGSTGVPVATTEAPRCPDAPPEIFPIQLGTPIGAVSQVEGLADYINVAYRYIVSIVLVAAIVMTVYGGFRYLFGASAGSVQEGKTIIRDALVGMLIVLAAYTILSTINPATTILQLGSIEKIQCVELDIPPAVASNRCENDSDCTGTGEHCVEAQYVYRTDLDEVVGGAARTGGEAGGEVGAATGIPGAETFGTWSGALLGFAGSGYYALFNMGGRVKMCSDGTNGAPCDSSSDCRPGFYCLTNWNLCTRPTNNPTGAPCGPLDQDTGATGAAEATCTEGLDCARPSGAVIGGRDYARCRGHVEPMLDISGYVSNDSRVPDDLICHTNQDCTPVFSGQITGMQCVGSENPWRGRYCYFDSSVQGELLHESEGGTSGRIRPRSGIGFSHRYSLTAEELYAVEPNVTPCVFNSGSITPLLCNGRTSTYTCVYCPSSGNRVWTYINDASGEGLNNIGKCAELTGVLGEPCT